ncbi:MAG TPA: ASCH domain-containing protein [Nocardioidaceae bacterium]|nr:ASCH domain-containing protein [Nocardioidaceae bacterium]
MSWPRIDGMRAMELGRPGESRRRFNGYVLHGEKRATAGLLALDYEQEDEPVEQVGELLALVDDDGRAIATLRVTDVAVRRFADVPWEFAQAEGEGFTSIEHWRDGHRRFWSRDGVDVTDDTRVVCVEFDVVDAPGSAAAKVDGD